MLAAHTIDPEGVKILARSFYRELREGGCSPKQILAASNELLDLVTREIRQKAEEVPVANGSDEGHARLTNGAA